jgi:D-sedoheptulose 7-phosphate isomerase
METTRNSSGVVKIEEMSKPNLKEPTGKMSNFSDLNDIQNILQKSLNEHIFMASSIADLLPDIGKVASILIDTFSQGNKLLICGNGGSASDAQHIAAELVGRFVKERAGLPAIALNTDTSILTSVANDYGYESIFSRQVQALSKPGDVVMGISTSGNSKNVVKALKIASTLNCQTVGLLGKDGGEIKEIADINIIVPSNNTARIQEMHILIGHMLCETVDCSIAL